MAFYKGRIHSRLVAADGYVGLNDVPPKATTPAQEEPQVSAVPSTCPYCNRSLADASLLASNLLRCGNSECGRCIYLEDAALAGAAD